MVKNAIAKASATQGHAMKQRLRMAALLLLAPNLVMAAPLITAIYTTYSASGVPTNLNITGTGLCANATCTTPPVVKLAGVQQTFTGGTPTGVGVKLVTTIDGDYVLNFAVGSSNVNYNFTLKSQSTGAGATLAVGTTTTGAAGTNASVTNTGTATAPILNFTVPRGATGPIGPAGPSGPQGTQGPIGLTGGTGPAGSVGAQGIAGPQGPQGSTGPKGDSGTNVPRLVVVDANGTIIGTPITTLLYGQMYEAVVVSSGSRSVAVPVRRDGFWAPIQSVYFETADCTGQVYMQDQGERYYNGTVSQGFVVKSSAPSATDVRAGEGTVAYYLAPNSVAQQVTWNSVYGWDGTKQICRSTGQPQTFYGFVTLIGGIDLGQFVAPFSTVILP